VDCGSFKTIYFYIPNEQGLRVENSKKIYFKEFGVKDRITISRKKRIWMLSVVIVLMTLVLIGVLSVLMFVVL